jgi:hypothetical protein
MRYKSALIIALMVLGAAMFMSCRPKVQEKPDRYYPELDGLAVRPLPPIDKDFARKNSGGNVRENAGRPKPATAPTQVQPSGTAGSPEEGAYTEKTTAPTPAGGG